MFFPDAEARRSHLLSLVDKVMEDGKAVSLAYTFESLCRFFSNKDASGLLGLPDFLPQVGKKKQGFCKVCLPLKKDFLAGFDAVCSFLCCSSFDALL